MTNIFKVADIKIVLYLFILILFTVFNIIKCLCYSHSNTVQQSELFSFAIFLKKLSIGINIHLACLC